MSDFIDEAMAMMEDDFRVSELEKLLAIRAELVVARDLLERCKYPLAKDHVNLAVDIERFLATGRVLL